VITSCHPARHQTRLDPDPGWRVGLLGAVPFDAVPGVVPRRRGFRPLCRVGLLMQARSFVSTDVDAVKSTEVL